MLFILRLYTGLVILLFCCTVSANKIEHDKKTAMGNITITNVNIPTEEVVQKTSQIVFMVPLHGDDENEAFELPKAPGEKVAISPKEIKYVIINLSSPNGEFISCEKKDFKVSADTKFDIYVGYRETEDGQQAYCKVKEP